MFTGRALFWRVRTLVDIATVGAETTTLVDCSYLLQPTGHGTPVDVLKEGGDIVSPFQSVVSDEGVLEDIHYQDGSAAGKVATLMLIYPLVDELASDIILIEYRPADAAHGPGRPEI